MRLQIAEIASSALVEDYGSAVIEAAPSITVGASEPALHVARRIDDADMILVRVIDPDDNLVGMVNPTTVIEYVQGVVGDAPATFVEAVMKLEASSHEELRGLLETRVKLYRCRKGGETRGGVVCAEHNSVCDPI
jgi:hypothetical protein